jgi:hypothetical protein
MENNDISLFDFAYCGNFDSKIEYLANLAEPENWGIENKVLKNYIKNYFKKIYQEEKFYLQENKCFIFNTGLLTKNYEEIFAILEPNKINNSQKWYLKGFFKESKILTSGLCKKEELPSLATFFNSFEDLYFDPRKEIILNKDHILDERKSRVPLEMDKKALLLILEGEIKTLKKRLERNHRLAVPQYYNNQIQFLLPLKLISEKTINSLVVSLKDDCYIAHTIFTLEMAYNNARLLMKPESEWLTI